MQRISYGYSKTSPPLGYVFALLCDNRFYVITQKQYLQAKRKAKDNKPIFQTDLPVYIDGINI